MTDLDLARLKDWPSGKVGVVVIAGRPNVGKSTFLNSILDYHLCAVASKPQTTRKNWRGIYSDDESQIIFVDTPGAHVGNTKLSEYMLEVIMDGLRDADVILCMADPSRSPGKEDQLLAERVGEVGKATVLLLNKTDLTTVEQRAETREFYLQRLPRDTQVYEICANERKPLMPILDDVKALLPQGPFFYEKDQMTDAFLRDIGAELIRESALELLHKEVPHSIAVEILVWKESPKKLRIEANIHVERDSQKLIVVGKGGSMIKQIQREAIKRLKEICEQRIDLRLFVKVSNDWRNRKSFLRGMGLTE